MITKQEVFEEKWSKYRNSARKRGKSFLKQVLKKPKKIWWKVTSVKICVDCNHKAETIDWTYCHYCKGELKYRRQSNRGKTNKTKST